MENRWFSAGIAKQDQLDEIARETKELLDTNTETEY